MTKVDKSKGSMTGKQLDEFSRFQHETGLTGEALRQAFVVRSSDVQSPKGNPSDATIKHPEAMPGRAKPLPAGWYEQKPKE